MSKKKTIFKIQIDDATVRLQTYREVNPRRRRSLHVSYSRSVPFDFQTKEIIDLTNSLLYRVSLYILFVKARKKKIGRFAFHAATCNPSSTTDAYEVLRSGYNAFNT